MKRAFTILVTLVMVLGLTVTAQALLVDNLDGTLTQTRSDGSRLMWLQDTNTAQTSGFDADGLMTWDQTNAWIDSLNSSTYLGYTDWRLPEILPGNGVSYNYQFTNDGSSDKGYNISGLHSEMGYMYYTELGFLGYCSPSDSFPCTPQQAQPGFGWKETNLDLFENLTGRPFWAAPLYVPTTPERQWVFAFNNGYQHSPLASNEYSAFAVRNMAPIPEPGTMLLLGSGLVGLAAYRKRRGQIDRLIY